MKPLLLLMIAGILCAEESKPVDVEITAEEQRDWQRARADLADLKAALEVATKAYQDKTNELARKCGDRPLVKNAQGDPSCAPRTPEKK